MLRNYLKIAFRHLLRHKSYAFINVAGLAVGIACCLVIFLYVRNERAVNTVFEEVDRIYRVDSVWREANMGLPFTTVAPAGVTLVREYPDVIEQVRIYGMSNDVRIGETTYREDVFMADPSILTLFGLPLVHGDPTTALTQPRSVAVTDTFAETAFGTTDVVGRTLLLETWNSGEQAYTVTAVMQKLPFNSVTYFGAEDGYDLFISPLPYGDFFPEDAWTAWFSRYIVQFVKLAPGASIATLNARLPDFIDTHAPAELHGDLDIRLNPLRTLYLTDGNGRGWKVVALLSAVAVLILLLAGINVTNLATAQSLARAREIGVRKALGAHRKQLVSQFLSESALTCLAATLAGALIAALCLGPFFALAEKRMVLPEPWDAITGLSLIGIAMAAGLLAGGYPALVLSAFKPVHVLKGTLRHSPATARLRQGLVVGQFAVAAGLLVAVYTVYRQMDYVLNRDLGFDRENVLVIHSAPRKWTRTGVDRMTAVKAHLENIPGVQAVSLSFDTNVRGDLPGNTRALRRTDWSPEQAVSIAYSTVDEDFLRTYDLDLEQGRFFSDARPVDAGGIVLNESAARAFGWAPEEAVGQPLVLWDSTRTVLGVIEDYHFQSLRQPIRPLALFSVASELSYRNLSLRLAGTDLPGTMARVRRAWNELLPGAPFEYRFLDDYVNEMYATEQQIRQVVGIAAALAILIACLGMLGLASLAAVQRTKEIGIRKVLGASAGSLFVLLSKDFVKLVAVGFLIAAPITYLGMNRWLANFAFHVEIGPAAFLLSGAVALTMALLAVSYQAVKVALADPVEALRYE